MDRLYIIKAENAGNLRVCLTFSGDTDYSRFHHLNDLTREICGATEMRILNYSGLKSST